MTTTKADRSVEYRPGPEMDGPGREYPDTPGPGRRFLDRSEGVIVQKRNFFMYFFAFQAILNTFYFWVKNLEKNILSPRKTPQPPITGKIFYIFISCFMPF